MVVYNFAIIAEAKLKIAKRNILIGGGIIVVIFFLAVFFCLVRWLKCRNECQELREKLPE